MKLEVLNAIMNNLTTLGIETLSVRELNNIGEFLVERNIKTIEDARHAVKQYLASK